METLGDDPGSISAQGIVVRPPPPPLPCLRSLQESLLIPAKQRQAEGAIKQNQKENTHKEETERDQ